MIDVAEALVARAAACGKRGRTLSTDERNRLTAALPVYPTWLLDLLSAVPLCGLELGWQAYDPEPGFDGVQAPQWLPRITRQRGEKTERLFWQSGGGYDRNITEPTTLMHVIEYIHANPVRRGLAEHPWKWKWSSAAYYMGRGESPIRLDPIPPEWVP